MDTKHHVSLSASIRGEKEIPLSNRKVVTAEQSEGPKEKATKRDKLHCYLGISPQMKSNEVNGVNPTIGVSKGSRWRIIRELWLFLSTC
jgi:hypothetical protein